MQRKPRPPAAKGWERAATLSATVCDPRLACDRRSGVRPDEERHHEPDRRWLLAGSSWRGCRPRLRLPDRHCRSRSPPVRPSTGKADRSTLKRGKTREAWLDYRTHPNLHACGHTGPTRTAARDGRRGSTRGALAPSQRTTRREALSGRRPQGATSSRKSRRPCLDPARRCHRTR